MKLVIFGASGSAGTAVLQQALSENHEVTAVLRNPEKLSTMKQSNLRIQQGDVLQYPDVLKAVRNQDAVLSLLGDGRKGEVRAAGTKNIIDAMLAEKVRRLITLSTLGVGESYGNLNFLWKHIMFGLFLKKAFRDHQLQEHYVINSDLNYTIVRPSALTDGVATKSYREGFDQHQKGLSLKINRADVAHFILKELSDKHYLRQAVSISN